MTTNGFVPLTRAAPEIKARSPELEVSYPRLKDWAYSGLFPVVKLDGKLGFYEESWPVVLDVVARKAGVTLHRAEPAEKAA